ncbi:MAG: tRNA lysidine(34) synthetase TilS [Proteobacteria bacterium]|nr:tRNA lysidine(34) synthetase TilS [Pseudomonadota bacterium]
MKIKLNEKLDKTIAYYANRRYAIAVSGGSDSLALLYLCAKLNPDNFIVVHFDHNLRDESSAEADFVEKTAKRLGLKFVKQVWNKTNISGNLYQQARRARYTFFKDIANVHNLEGVLVAHSKTDLAETLLMRLGKGSSLKGASIFPDQTEIFGVNVIRPLLAFTRKDLQDYLSERKITWMVDPHNKDEKKLRPRIRKLLPDLEKAGVSLNGMLSSCKYFNQANSALDIYVQKDFDELFYCKELRYFSIDKKDLFAKPLETQIRLILKIINKFNLISEDKTFRHTPRRKKLIELLNRLKKSSQATEEIDILNIELHKNSIYIYEKLFKKLANYTYLDEIDKNIRYTIIRDLNLQILPVKLRNRIKENSILKLRDRKVAVGVTKLAQFKAKQSKK